MKKILAVLLIGVLCAILSGAELLYCLQPTLKRRIFPDRAAATGRSHIVVDEAYDGSPDTRWGREEMKAFRKKGAVLLCYFSVGEAEDYRGYWQQSWKKNPPSFLLKENPEWKGNYQVRYWEKAWQQIILKELDRIVEAGFDGVYLDIVDGFETFEELAHKEFSVNPATGKSYREDMISWILTIAKRARSKNPKFQIFMQNGEALLTDKNLFRAVNGIVAEDLFFDRNKRRKKSEIEVRMRFLRPCMETGKTCFAVEYVPRGKHRDVQNLSRQYGIPVLITDRELKKFGTFFTVSPQ